MYKLNEDFFKNIDNEKSAYWLGFIMADGCINEVINKKTKKLKSMNLSISLSTKDNHHLEKFLNDIESDCIVRDEVLHSKGKEYNYSRVQIYNTNICRDLIKLNCVPRKSLILKYPEGKIPECFEKDFIRGYFDGDGSVSFTEHLQYHKNKGKYYMQKSFYANILGTQNFLEVISEILSKNDIKNSIKKYSANVPEIRITGSKNLLNFAHYIYDNFSVCLDRKYNKFIQAFPRYDLAF